MIRFTRDTRLVLATAALVLPLLAGCGTDSPAASTESSPVSTQAVAPAAELSALEQQYGAQVGLFAVDTGSGKTVTNRADQRFPFLSTFKGLAAAALLKAHPLDTGYFDRVIHYTEANLVDYSPVTGAKVAEGMTIAQIADAAITQSDNTAGNLLLRELGGPQGLTDFLRTIGDQVGRLDRWEPDLNTAYPDDERDTTTPAALAAAYRALVVGDALGAPERDQLTKWLKANTTGDKRIRAGLPAGWSTGDKTGTGSYGMANDVAVTWPEGNQSPIVIAIQTRKPTETADPSNDLVAATTKLALTHLR
ncbi:class A beta-lactamase [Nocardia brasiliensis]|uniref:Beta-lactamase n=1 Tax=Nocardia brasiliensis TaxID=37326 RepID=A0A6G9XK16_NOCBR|nr:class A beta-lactamase [Nocardia brasiliensis]QIS01238.1 class A beta-lactamase [Nocardia brasiliensis]